MLWNFQCFADSFEISGNTNLEMGHSKYPQVPSYLPTAGLDPCVPVSYQRLAPDDGNRRPARVHPRGARGELPDLLAVSQEPE